MKTPFLLALSGLAIGFAVPTLAQQKETVDPQVREQIDANIKKSDEAFNNNDAAALAAERKILRTIFSVVFAVAGAFVASIESRNATICVRVISSRPRSDCAPRKDTLHERLFY